MSFSTETAVLTHYVYTLTQSVKQALHLNKKCQTGKSDLHEHMHLGAHNCLTLPIHQGNGNPEKSYALLTNSSTTEPICADAVDGNISCAGNCRNATSAYEWLDYQNLKQHLTVPNSTLPEYWPMNQISQESTLYSITTHNTHQNSTCIPM
jgi:hypothetical protein